MDIFVTWENTKNNKDLISYLQAGDYSMWEIFWKIFEEKTYLTLFGPIARNIKIKYLLVSIILFFCKLLK